VTDPGKAVFLSYASQDAEAAQKLCNALRAAGIEVWFDQSELRGGDAWDQMIRRQIKGCYLFVSIISANTQSREEGYFRREWKIAVDRTNDMAEDRAFLLPIVIDGTSDSEARVPEKFCEVQWTRLPASGNADAFVEHVRRLIDPNVTMPTSASVGTSVPSTSSTGAALPRLTPQASRSLVPWVVGGLLILATGYLAANKFFVPERAAPAAKAPATLPAHVEAVPDKSVAVLPFVDMSEKKDQEYFSDGLSEELIDHLAHAADLKVIARTSSFQFKGRNEDMRTIGQRLGVANLLEGSVRKSGNTLRITVQLVRADTGYHVWSETYDRKADDIFKIQDEIAASVLQALKASMAQRSAEKMIGTQNIEAYNLYLQGHAIYKRANTRTDYEMAVDYVRRAIKADPSYPQAWALISAVLSEGGEDGFAPINSARQESRHAAERALELDPMLADAHVAMGRYLIVDELDLKGGERHVQQALELEPNNQWALAWAGTLAAVRGQFQTGTSLLQRSIVSDPVNPWRYRDLAHIYFLAGKYSEALDAFHRAIDLNPADTDRHLFPVRILLAQGDPLAALAEIDRENDEKLRLGCECRAIALDALGRKAEADAALSDLVKNHAADDAYGIALVFGRRRDLDQAFDWLDRAYRQREPGLLDLKFDPLLKNVQTDPRFAALLKKMRLMD
jgi:TolB-like protein/cytochrome c-type biogenesis protein CcmH/NrfG